MNSKEVLPIVSKEECLQELETVIETDKRRHQLPGNGFRTSMAPRKLTG
jgi:hypothetical protein